MQPRVVLLLIPGISFIIYNVANAYLLICGMVPLFLLHMLASLAYYITNLSVAILAQVS